MASSIACNILSHPRREPDFDCGHVTMATKLPNSAELTTKKYLPFSRKEQQL